VDPKHSVADFIELYLTIDLPRKEVDLIKLRSILNSKNKDQLEESVLSFRNAISHTKKHFHKFRTKSHYGLPEVLESIIHLSPEEFFLLLAKPRYNLSTETISLILKLPEETITFQTNHLRSLIQLSDTDLKSLHTKLQPLEKKRFSQVQKLKSKLRPQRFILESVVTTVTVVFVLWSIPQIRKKYDNWALKKTSEYFVSNEIKEAPIPVELNNKPNIIEPEAAESTEEARSQQPKAERKQPKVSEGEVWRFSFTGTAKGDLEKELKAIVQKFAAQQLKPSVAPGGIQFDTFIKTSDLIEIKTAFESLTDAQANTLKMSWYKKKNMGTKKIPSAHVEVVVWISTI